MTPIAAPKQGIAVPASSAICSEQTSRLFVIGRVLQDLTNRVPDVRLSTNGRTKRKSRTRQTPGSRCATQVRQGKKKEEEKKEKEKKEKKKKKKR